MASSQAVAAPPSLHTKPPVHWSLYAASLLSLATLGIYSYVYLLCRKNRKRVARGLSPVAEGRRLWLARGAFALDLLISAYFSSVTPRLLASAQPFTMSQRATWATRRQMVQTMPRPLFWFFAVTGLVPTVSMTATVIGGALAKERLRNDPAWRRLHAIVAAIAYVSWWVAIAPILAIGVVGEKRAIRWLNAQMRERQTETDGAA